MKPVGRIKIPKKGYLTSFGSLQILDLFKRITVSSTAVTSKPIRENNTHFPHKGRTDQPTIKKRKNNLD